MPNTTPPEVAQLIASFTPNTDTASAVDRLVRLLGTSWPRGIAPQLASALGVSRQRINTILHTYR